MDINEIGQQIEEARKELNRAIKDYEESQKQAPLPKWIQSILDWLDKR